MNGRVVKEYVGAGDLADALAILDALDRQSTVLQAEEPRWERECRDDLHEVVAGFCRTVDAVVADALRHAGFHRHAHE